MGEEDDDRIESFAFPLVKRDGRTMMSLLGSKMDLALSVMLSAVLLKSDEGMP